MNICIDGGPFLCKALINIQGNIGAHVSTVNVVSSQKIF